MFKDKLKGLKFIDYLIFFYIFFLPFIRIGIRVLRYTFTICDVILAVIFLRYIYLILFKKFNFAKIYNVTKKFLILYSIFLICISVSIIGVKNLNNAIAELLAFIYAFIIILVFSLYLLERGKKGLQIIFSSFTISLIIISLLSFTILIKIGQHNILYHSDHKYIFFTFLPNQLSMFLIVCFCIFFISNRNFLKSNIFNDIIKIILPVLFVIAEFFTQSRTGVFVAILLAIYFYIKNIRYLRKSVLFIIIILGLVFLFKKIDDFRRPLSVFKSIISGEYTDDIRIEMFTKAIEAFKSNPITGTGLGNFRGIWHTHEVHNTFLAILAETGLLGFISFCVLFIWFFIRIVFKLVRKISRKIDYIIIFIAMFIYNFQHYVLRERWNWVLFIYLLLFSYMENVNQKND